MFENVKADLRKYIFTEEVRSFFNFVNLILFNYSLWVILSYRLGQWVRIKFKIPVLRQILKITTRISHSLIGLLTGIQIPLETKIGPGLYIGHIGTIVINANAVIGSNCTIGIGVVIGQGGRGEKKGNPILGNRVYVGVGAKIIGKIKIGDNVAIGANAVVTKDVPSNASVAGVPAKIINYLGSREFIRND